MNKSLYIIFSVGAALLLTAPGPVRPSVVDEVISGVEEAVTYIASRHCRHVKQIVGIVYDKIDDPDMSKLTIDFMTKNTTVKYNLTDLPNILSSQWFNPNKGLVIYMHGFTDNPSGHSFQALNNAFHNRSNLNVLALDASPYISYFYLRSSILVMHIGEALGKGLASLTEAGVPPYSIHLIGHSLGSHIAGFTGNTLYKLTGAKVGRITGLDPAGPCFADVNSTLRLNKTDANFVDVIHTDAGVYGLNEVIGHVDYFPNNGTDQPGCSSQTCSHSRAWELFAESVFQVYGFPALRCDNWNNFDTGKCDSNCISYMGYATNTFTRGTYYLTTNGKSPFARGRNGIWEMEFDS